MAKRKGKTEAAAKTTDRADNFRTKPESSEVSLAGISRPLSLVAQAERTLRTAIENSVFPNGKLPTLLDLADQLRVSRETVRLALESLQQEGLIVKRRRRGTFVRRPEVPAALRQPQSKMLGCLLEEFDSVDKTNEVVSWPSSRQMLEGAVFEASQRGYQINVRSARPSNLRDTFDQMDASSPMGGIIFACVVEEKFLKSLSGRGLPAILMDHQIHLPNVGSIRSDSEQCTIEAVEQLVKLGHRRIACAHWRQNDLNPWFVQGYRKGMREAKLRCRRLWEISSELSQGGASKAIDQLLSVSPRPTAIICFHNTFANQVVRAAVERGLRVPEDLSVVGGGGEEVVNLSCTQLDWSGIGRKAVQMLLSAIEQGDEYKAQHIRMPYFWQGGGTTAAPSPDASAANK